MMCAEIMRQAGNISDEEWNFFLRGAGSIDKVSYLFQPLELDDYMLKKRYELHYK